MDFRNEIQKLLILFLIFHSIYWFNLVLSLHNISNNHFITILISELNKLDENYCEDDIIAPWKVTKWLMLSSFIFGLPSIYGIYNGIYVLPILIIFASIISANHWRFGMHNSWRRILDLVCAKITCFILFIYNIIYIRTTLHKILVYILIIPTLYCFYLSNTIYIPKSPSTSWRDYHFMFHILCTCIGFLFMYNIARYKH